MNKGMSVLSPLHVTSFMKCQNSEHVHVRASVRKLCLFQISTDVLPTPVNPPARWPVTMCMMALPVTVGRGLQGCFVRKVHSIVWLNHPCFVLDSSPLRQYYSPGPCSRSHNLFIYLYYYNGFMLDVIQKCRSMTEQ